MKLRRAEVGPGFTFWTNWEAHGVSLAKLKPEVARGDLPHSTNLDDVASYRSAQELYEAQPGGRA